MEGEEKDLSEIIRVFLFVCGTFSQPGPLELGAPQGDRGTPAPPCDPPCAGSCLHHLSSGVFQLPEPGEALPARKLQWEIRLEPGVGLGGRCAVIPPVQGQDQSTHELPPSPLCCSYTLLKPLLS